MTACPHIGIVTSSLGGAAKLMLNIARELANDGCDVDIVFVGSMEYESDRIPECVRLVDARASRELTSIPNLIKYTKRREPDILISTGIGTSLITVWSKYMSRVSFAVVIRMGQFVSYRAARHGRIKNAIIPILARMSLPLADALVANTRDIAADIIDFSALSQDDVTIIQNPTVTTELFELAEIPVELPWDSAEDFEVIMSAGRFIDEKDFSNLISAFAEVAKHRNVRLLIAGDGELRSEIAELVERLNLSELVWFPGHVENPFKYMNRADLFALSSKIEGQPNVLIEALACGTQVVSTRASSGPIEILENGAHGTLVPVGEPHRLADGIRRELDTERNTDALIQRAGDFSVQTVVEDYIPLLADVTET